MKETGRRSIYYEHFIFWMKTQLLNGNLTENEIKQTFVTVASPLFLSFFSMNFETGKNLNLNEIEFVFGCDFKDLESGEDNMISKPRLGEEDWCVSLGEMEEMRMFKTEADKILDQADKNSDGLISYSEYLKYMDGVNDAIREKENCNRCGGRN